MIIAERPELRLKDDVAPGRPAYFWWFIANGMALCFAVASWLVCLEVFGNPEVPRNYEILRSIGRVPELKLFPAEQAGGVGMLKALAGPLPEMRFCPTGGVSPSNLTQYLKQPNVAMVGESWLTPASALEQGRWQDITDLAAQASALAAAQ
jgi:Entner-Doudoroff aldolase